MIRNNNQNGRRRGRGGARPPQGGGPSGNYGNANGGGSRIDTRQRGNATQLLEKYKAMARDATQNGDRVQAEFYMQYADHYYRVLNEFRARDPQPAPRQSYDDDGDDGYNNANVGQNYASPQTDGRYVDDGDGDDGDDDSGRREVQPQRPNGERQAYDRGAAEPSRADAPRQQRDYNGTRDGNGRDHGQREQARESSPRDNAPRDNAQRESSSRDNGQRTDNSRGPDRAHRDDTRERQSGTDARERFAAPRRDDGQRETVTAREPDSSEFAIMAGLPGPATVAATALVELPVVGDGEVPVARRRGRPRKIVAVSEDAPDA